MLVRSDDQGVRSSANRQSLEHILPDMHAATQSRGLIEFLGTRERLRIASEAGSVSAVSHVGLIIDVAVRATTEAAMNAPIFRYPRAAFVNLRTIALVLAGAMLLMASFFLGSYFIPIRSAVIATTIGVPLPISLGCAFLFGVILAGTGALFVPVNSPGVQSYKVHRLALSMAIGGLIMIASTAAAFSEISYARAAVLIVTGSSGLLMVGAAAHRLRRGDTLEVESHWGGLGGGIGGWRVSALSALAVLSVVFIVLSALVVAPHSTANLGTPAPRTTTPALTPAK